MYKQFFPSQQKEKLTVNLEEKKKGCMSTSHPGKNEIRLQAGKMEDGWEFQSLILYLCSLFLSETAFKAISNKVEFFYKYCKTLN